MPIRISRSGRAPTPVERARAARPRRARTNPRVAQQRGELVLIGEERVVAELGVELPQRRRRAGGLQLAIQLVLQREREQHVAGHADDEHVGGHARELARAPPSVPSRSIASLSKQERPHREPLGEPLAVMIEVRGDRRVLELGREHAEPRVELVAAAVRQHAELARARHAGRDVAGALAVAHELALQVARRGAPAVGPQPGARS